MAFDDVVATVVPPGFSEQVLGVLVESAEDSTQRIELQRLPEYKTIWVLAIPASLKQVVKVCVPALTGV